MLRAGMTRPQIQKIQILSPQPNTVEDSQLLEVQEFLAELAKKVNEIIDHVNEWS